MRNTKKKRRGVDFFQMGCGPKNGVWWLLLYTLLVVYFLYYYDVMILLDYTITNKTPRSTIYLQMSQHGPPWDYILELCPLAGIDYNFPIFQRYVSPDL
jgi:hypothetical protein